MSTRRLSARLKRVEAQLPARNPDFEFIQVDESFLDEWHKLPTRLADVKQAEFWAMMNEDGPLAEAKRQERYDIEARLDEMARSLPVPAGYGGREAAIDEGRISELQGKQTSSAKSERRPLTEAEKREYQQCELRHIAYYYRPCTFEDLARGRINDLYVKYDLSPEEQQEYDEVLAVYPRLSQPNETLERMRDSSRDLHEVFKRNNLKYGTNWKYEDTWGFDRLKHQEYIAAGRKMMSSIPATLLKYFQ
jgi:hypothetical protein